MKRRQFRVRNLLLGWSAYWLALIAVGVTPAIVAIRHVAGLPPGNGNFNAGLGDKGLQATVIERGVTTYSGSISLIPLTLLIAVPPLVMWLIFIWTTRTRDADESLAGDQEGVTALNEGGAGTQTFRPSSTTSRRTSREGS